MNLDRNRGPARIAGWCADNSAFQGVPLDVCADHGVGRGRTGLPDLELGAHRRCCRNGDRVTDLVHGRIGARYRHTDPGIGTAGLSVLDLPGGFLTRRVAVLVDDAQALREEEIQLEVLGYLTFWKRRERPAPAPFSDRDIDRDLC
ncbi:hypothetical protein FQZ97_938860 [compost metagenome]